MRYYLSICLLFALSLTAAADGRKPVRTFIANHRPGWIIPKTAGPLFEAPAVIQQAAQQPIPEPDLQIPDVYFDYAPAYAEAAKTGRPLAVFLLDGDTDIPVSAETCTLLATKYVTVILESHDYPVFNLYRGLVISTPGGMYEAFRQTGLKDFSTQLTKYANQPTPATPTCANGKCRRP